MLKLGLKCDLFLFQGEVDLEVLLYVLVEVS